MKPFSVDVNLDEEAVALFDFINKTWAGPVGFPQELVTEIKNSAVRDARMMVNSFKVELCIKELLTIREEALGAEFALHHYDSTAHFLKEVWKFLHRSVAIGLALEGASSLSQKASALSSLCRQVKGLEELVPVEGRVQEDLFEGNETYSISRTNIPLQFSGDYVKQVLELCFIHPLDQLVNAVYMHFFKIAEEIHTEKVCAELRNLPGLRAPAIEFEPYMPTLPFLKVMRGIMADEPSRIAYLTKKEALKQGIRQKQAVDYSDINSPIIRSQLAQHYKDQDSLIKNMLVKEFKP